MRLDHLNSADDVSVAIRDELYIVAALLSTIADAAGRNFHGREEECSALIYGAAGKVDEILLAITEALASESKGEGRVAA